MKEKKPGKVYIVGAGCGDAELITWKGLRLLRQCDVVLYDDLSAARLLEETKEGCEKIPVGKRFGKHSAAQEEINVLLVEKAKEGRNVVRLKGGDPFVFGRGGEEILALQAAGVPYEEVSGITAAVAVPAAAGIPVTHRKLARSFHVITGHTAENGLPEDFETLARLDGTLVFLMGLHHLEEIAEGLLKNGKRPDTPAAVVSRGATAAQRVVHAPLGEIAAAVRAAGLEAPAVIIVGAVAGLDFSGTIAKELQGVRIGVTGTHSIVRKLREGLEELGAEVTEMEISCLMPYAQGDALAAALHGQGWLVFTSPNGVEIFFAGMQERRQDIRTLAGWKFAVIGPGTARALAKRGIFAAYMPEQYNVESLAAGLCEAARQDKEVLILRAEQGSPVLTEHLAAAGIPFREIKLYDIAVDRERLSAAREKAEEMDFITFASGSGVRNFLEDGGKLPEGVRAVCIGQATAEVLREYGYDSVTAEESSAEGILRAVLWEREKLHTEGGRGGFV